MAISWWVRVCVCVGGGGGGGGGPTTYKFVLGISQKGTPPAPELTSIKINVFCFVFVCMYLLLLFVRKIMIQKITVGNGKNPMHHYKKKIMNMNAYTWLH